MKNLFYTCIVVAIIAGFAFGLGQDLAKNTNQPAETKPLVTTAKLSPEEMKEGKEIITDAQKFGVQREAAQKVFTETLKNTPEARLLAYDSWWSAAQGLEVLQVKMNKLIARAQERTGCKDCGIDFDKGTLAVQPAK